MKIAAVTFSPDLTHCLRARGVQRHGDFFRANDKQRVFELVKNITPKSYKRRMYSDY